MTTKAAFIYIAPENDSKKHQAFIDSPVVSLKVIGVKTSSSKPWMGKHL